MSSVPFFACNLDKKGTGLIFRPNKRMNIFKINVAIKCDKLITLFKRAC